MLSWYNSCVSRQYMQTNIKMIKLSQSWKDPKTHFKKVLKSNWYRIIGKLQSEFVKATVEFL